MFIVMATSIIQSSVRSDMKRAETVCGSNKVFNMPLRWSLEPETLDTINMALLTEL